MPEYKKVLKNTIKGAVVGAAVAVVAAGGVYAAGFTTSGVAAGSIAAGLQSSIGLVQAGSAFAGMQSIGATGALLTVGLPVAIGVGATAGVIYSVNKFGTKVWEQVRG